MTSEKRDVRFLTRDLNDGERFDREELAAELTEAAFPIALRHGIGTDWLDRKLELWNAMARTVNAWER